MDILETDFGYGSTEFHTLKSTKSILPKFLYLITRSERFMALGEAFMTGSAGQKRGPSSFIRQFSIGLPPIAEQAEITSYIDTETARIDDTIRTVEQEIGLLTEYRSALISEVVTGKMRVV